MLNEFYNYISDNIIGYFQKLSLRPGERYCLKLDNEEMVVGVDAALSSISAQNNIKGNYSYKDVYSTFTIKLHDGVELVIASKVNGMTDDFLATLRNAELTSKKHPILMITHSSIDTISSGTGDLTAKGMPFHSESIINNIKIDIQKAQLNVYERVLLENELERKQLDRFSDKSSLFEYADILTVLNRGYVKKEDCPKFALLPDEEISIWVDEKKIKERLADNHKLFEKIDRVFRYGNIQDNLSGEFDKPLIDHIVKCKRQGEDWFNGQSYKDIKASQDKMKKKLDNPLRIDDSDFIAYSNTAIEYSFEPDKCLFVKSDGSTAAKKRKKNILVFNPDAKAKVTIEINTNIYIPQSNIEHYGCNVNSSARKITVNMNVNGCTFAFVTINDANNNIKYVIKVCVIDVAPRYLENIQTSYLFGVTKTLKNAKIQVFGVSKELIINPGAENHESVVLEPGCVITSKHDTETSIVVDEDSINSDAGFTECSIKIGSIIIPISIKDESSKPVELTGANAFKWKHEHGKSLEYRAGNKIVSGTIEFYAREPFKTTLEAESYIIENDALFLKLIDGEYEKIALEIPENVKQAYLKLISTIRIERSLPSLAFYGDNDLKKTASDYVNAVIEEIHAIPTGCTLDLKYNNMLLLGCIKNEDSNTLEMSPLHPLNVFYQLKLLEEIDVGKIRDNLVEKLSVLNMLPYVRDNTKLVYKAIEQKHSPEWSYYAPFADQRFKGARNFVQKLVCDKIAQYKEHFGFLFDDLGNYTLIINLINMGDCKEVFQGIISFYVQCLRENGYQVDSLLCFDINIYSNHHIYNAFDLLSNHQKLKDFISEKYGAKDIEDINELAIALESKIKCYYKNPKESEYEYAHIAFYEMQTSDDLGSGRMDSITTGISLGGITSGTPSVLNSDWYKTGFGTKYAKVNDFVDFASRYNALFRVAYTGSSYEPDSGIFTEIAQGQEGQIGKIYESSNWVVFVDPKVDLSFFQKQNFSNNELMIIHYSDQYTSSSGYDDITVTQKSEQYNEIIKDQLHKKGVTATTEQVNQIISLFNAVNGGWMLRLITSKKHSGAADSYFSREKMSILSAIKLCMAYYEHSNIIWVPLSLEEMLRVSGGAGLSQKEGLLSARNLGFEQRATSDDILLVGIEGPSENIKIHLHPIEVKIGLNPSPVIDKAKTQALNTYNGLWSALYPEDGKNILERKLSRNFFMQVVITCCEKMKLYGVSPDTDWDIVLDKYREKLLNEEYVFSNNLEQYIGKGTVVSFSAGAGSESGAIDSKTNVCVLEFPEKMGSDYLVLSTKEIEQNLENGKHWIPKRLCKKYFVDTVDMNNSGENTRLNATAATSHDVQTNVVSENNICTKESEPVAPIVQHEENQDKKKEHVDGANVTENANTTGMTIVFGRDEAFGNDVVWRPNDTNQVFHTNTGIIGTMGTGKTQFTKSLITQLYRERNNNFGSAELGILIFDYKGDYNESKEDFIKATNAKVLKPYHLPYNPLALTESKVFKPLLPIHTANAFKDTLAKVYGLGAKQQNSLFQCIIEAYSRRGINPSSPETWKNDAPTFNDVYNIYYDNEDIKKNDSLAAAMDKLFQFQVFESNVNETKALFELLKGVVVVDLSGYDSDIQSLIVAITLDLFYSQMQAAGSSKLNEQYRELTKLILVDEADNFMSEGFPSLKKILKEGREFGVGTILSTQFLKHFGSTEDDYAKYILTWVVHNVADLKNSDIDYVFKTDAKSSESQTLYNDIKSLEKHHSIIKIGTGRHAYVKDKAFWELYKEIRNQ